MIATLTLMLPIASATGQATSPQQRPNAERSVLEQRLRERTAEVVRRRLQLTDTQMAQLQVTNARFEQQRGELIARERIVRRDLRTQLASGDSADQARVGSLLDQLMSLERQRLDLVQGEQRDLAKFLTPVQRARLFGLQNQIRQRMQELRNGERPGMNRPPRPGAMRMNR